MPLDPKIIRNVKAAQERVFRLAARDHGLTLKAIHLDSGIDYDSLRRYASGENQMPVGALYALVGVIPAELLSLLLPDEHVIVRVPEGIDFDEFSAACREFVDAKEAAHHPESEAGREIGPTENVVLLGKAARARAA